MGSFLAPLVLPNIPSRVLTNTRNDSVVARTLPTAFDPCSRRRGLLHHVSLPEGTGLIIAPSNAIHTCFMRFAIDVAFVSRDGRGLSVRPAMRPWRIAAAWRGFAVIELPAGALDRAATRTGDTLRIATI